MLEISYKSILKMAIPLMVSSFIQSIVLITDASYISRYSTVAFDAVGNGGLVYITLFMALAGIGDGTQILIARRIGQDKEEAIGRIFGTSLFITLLLATFLFLIIQLVLPDFLHQHSRHADIGRLQSEYIKIRGFALFAAMISLPVQAFFLALGKSWVVSISALITAISNILLDNLLIFGKAGFPELGLRGAAWASTIADIAGMLFLLSVLILGKDGKKHALFAHFSFNLPSVKELIKVGSPLMFQGIIALATWTIFFGWLEQLGKFELTVSQNVRTFYFLAFVPIWGFAGTTKTYVSQYMGKGDFQAIRTIQKKIILLSILFLAIFFHGALLYPDTLIRLINPEESYVHKSGEILQFITGSILLFSIFSVFLQTINGSGNTIVSLVIEIISVLSYIIAAYLLIKVIQPDIRWIWSVEYVYFGTTGILSIVYLRFFNWKKKQV